MTKSIQYANQNAGITNREIEYNTQVRDRQSMADAKSRGDFYSDVLQARDNQRMQKLQAIQDLSRAKQLNARQNKSGNMIMKTFPHFNENLDYNGNEYHPYLPVDENMPFIPQSQPTQATTKPKKQVKWKINNKDYTGQEPN